MLSHIKIQIKFKKNTLKNALNFWFIKRLLVVAITASQILGIFTQKTGVRRKIVLSYLPASDAKAELNLQVV